MNKSKGMAVFSYKMFLAKQGHKNAKGKILNIFYTRFPCSPGRLILLSSLHKPVLKDFCDQILTLSSSC